MNNLICPICHDDSVEELLSDFNFTAASNSDILSVSGITAYRCDVAGHIFFVRETDVETNCLVA